MTESSTRSDLGLGLSIVFVALAIVGALVTTGTSYLNAISEGHGWQLYAGAAFGVTLLFAAVAIAVTHVYAE